MRSAECGVQNEHAHTPQVSSLTPQVSRLKSHASRLKSHASRLKSHASSLTPVENVLDLGGISLYVHLFSSSGSTDGEPMGKAGFAGKETDLYVKQQKHR